jgi:hypothetical protein
MVMAVWVASGSTANAAQRRVFPFQKTRSAVISPYQFEHKSGLALIKSIFQTPSDEDNRKHLKMAAKKAYRMELFLTEGAKFVLNFLVDPERSQQEVEDYEENYDPLLVEVIEGMLELAPGHLPGFTKAEIKKNITAKNLWEAMLDLAGLNKTKGGSEKVQLFSKIRKLRGMPSIEDASNFAYDNNSELGDANLVKENLIANERPDWQDSFATDSDWDEKLEDIGVYLPFGREIEPDQDYSVYK